MARNNPLNLVRNENTSRLRMCGRAELKGGRGAGRGEQVNASNATKLHF